MGCAGRGGGRRGRRRCQNRAQMCDEQSGRHERMAHWLQHCPPAATPPPLLLLQRRLRRQLRSVAAVAAGVPSFRPPSCRRRCRLAPAHPSRRAMSGWSEGKMRLKERRPPTASAAHACTSKMVYSTDLRPGGGDKAGSLLHLPAVLPARQPVQCWTGSAKLSLACPGLAAARPGFQSRPALGPHAPLVRRVLAGGAAGTRRKGGGGAAGKLADLLVQLSGCRGARRRLCRRQARAAAAVGDAGAGGDGAFACLLSGTLPCHTNMAGCSVTHPAPHPPHPPDCVALLRSPSASARHRCRRRAARTPPPLPLPRASGHLTPAACCCCWGARPRAGRAVSSIAQS